VLYTNLARSSFWKAVNAAFWPIAIASLNIFSCQGSSPMSLAGPRNNRERNLSGCGSRDTIHQLTREMSFEELSRYLSQESMLTIEELKEHMNSCFTCGVSWNEEHVSLDCSECGGYSLERPCPRCEGQCQAVWKRDLAVSHSSGKAHWSGECCHRESPTSTPDLLQSLVKQKETSTSRRSWWRQDIKVKQDWKIFANRSVDLGLQIGTKLLYAMKFK